MSSFNFVSFQDWYSIIHQSFFKKINFDLYYVADMSDKPPFYQISSYPSKNKHSILFFDQEPVHTELISTVVNNISDWYFTPGQRFFVTSERSNTVNRYTQGMNATSIYYFFHAIAANEWYHQYRWNRPEYVDHQHLYITYNHLITTYRAHRIDLVSRLYNKNLISQGLVSFKCPNQDDLARAINDCQWYTGESLGIFNQEKHNLKTLTIDTDSVNGTLSANVDFDSSRKAFVQIVTETDFYKDKLHLTEKVFKPIVAGQPFLLLAGQGNLSYLREYGFQTFGNYWDESYDRIADPGHRVGAVVKITEDLANLTHTQQQNMRRDMQPIIEHNFNHLFFDVRPIVVAELTNNIAQALKSQDIRYNPADLRELYRLLVN
jgi:hypothetical protein